MTGKTTHRAAVASDAESQVVPSGRTVEQPGMRRLVARPEHELGAARGVAIARADRHCLRTEIRHRQRDRLAAYVVLFADAEGWFSRCQTALDMPEESVGPVYLEVVVRASRRPRV